MRIVVDDIAASKTGALSVLRDFYNAVSEYEKTWSGNEWIFVLGDKLLEERENIKVLVRDDVKRSRKNRLVFDLKTGADYFKSLKPDVLFSLQNTLPRGYRGKQVLYVHQPLSYQTWKKFSFFKPEEREYAIYQYLIGNVIDSSVKRADKVIVQTEWMRRAVIGKTKVYEEGQRIRVCEGVYEGVETRILKVNRQKSRMQIEIPFADRLVRTWVEYEIVKPAEQDETQSII